MSTNMPTSSWSTNIGTSMTSITAIRMVQMHRPANRTLIGIGTCPWCAGTRTIPTSIIGMTMTTPKRQPTRDSARC
jgi:hypothetical protein